MRKQKVGELVAHKNFIRPELFTVCPETRIGPNWFEKGSRLWKLNVGHMPLDKVPVAVLASRCLALRGPLESMHCGLPGNFEVL
jgi:hypothetical protein